MDFPVGSRVMFTGPYGVSEEGAYSEWLAVQKESLCLIPEGVDDVSAAGIPGARQDFRRFSHPRIAFFY